MYRAFSERASHPFNEYFLLWFFCLFIVAIQKTKLIRFLLHPAFIWASNRKCAVVHASRYTCITTHRSALIKINAKHILKWRWKEHAAIGHHSQPTNARRRQTDTIQWASRKSFSARFLSPTIHRMLPRSRTHKANKIDAYATIRRLTRRYIVVIGLEPTGTQALLLVKSEKAKIERQKN